MKKRGLLAAIVLGLAAPATVLAHGPQGHEEEAVQASPEEEAAQSAAQQQKPAAPAPTGTGAAVETEQLEPSRIPHFLTNLHPATVHFPIALLLFAAFAELLSIARPGGRSRAAADIAAASGGIAASVAALFGWIHTGLWLGGGDIMQWHRWLGTGLGALGPVIALLALRKDESRLMLRLLLGLSAAAIIAQGWLGGELAHGFGHLWE